MSVVVFHELYDAYNDVRLRTARPPVEIRVLTPEQFAKDHMHPRDVALVTIDGWRECVRAALVDMLVEPPTDAQVEQYMRRPNWRFYDIPVRLCA